MDTELTMQGFMDGLTQNVVHGVGGYSKRSKTGDSGTMIEGGAHRVIRGTQGSFYSGLGQSPIETHKHHGRGATVFGGQGEMPGIMGDWLGDGGI